MKQGTRYIYEINFTYNVKIRILYRIFVTLFKLKMDISKLHRKRYIKPVSNQLEIRFSNHSTPYEKEISYKQYKLPNKRLSILR